MTLDTRLATTSAVDPQTTAAMAIYDRLAPLKDALGIKDLSEPELQLFAMVAYQTGLDPFTRQIYAIRRKGKITHQTGIDGYRSVAERTGQYRGSTEATFEECPCKAQPQPHPSLARVVVRRATSDGDTFEQVGIARWHELVPDEDFMWKRQPFNQLAKCAEANGLRKAFPRVLGGVYIEEEMQQAGPAENAALVAAAARPTASERLAARREAVEAQVVVIQPERNAEAASGLGLDDPALWQEPQTPPPPLTKEQIRELLDGAGITTAEAMTKAAELWPGFNPHKEMTDKQRGILWDSLG